MARGKPPLVSHALPKQQTLLDCFLEAQAKRTKRRRRSADAAPVDGPDEPNALATDEAEPLQDDAVPAPVKTARAV